MNNDMSVLSLLSETEATAESRANRAYGDYAGSHQGNCVLFGAGNLGRKVASGLMRLPLNVRAIVDNQPTKWGMVIEGIPVVSPAQALEQHSDIPWIVTIYSPGHAYIETEAWLKARGVTRVVPFGALAWQYPQVFLPHIQLQRPEDCLRNRASIAAVHQLLADDESKHQFAGFLRWRLLLDYHALPKPDLEHQYFPHDLFPQANPHEIFVDGGAYDGDTLTSWTTQFCPKFQAWYAYEPDETARTRLESVVKELTEDIHQRIRVFPQALSDRPGRLAFTSLEGAGSQARDLLGGNEGPTVSAVSLDDLEILPPTYIKLDVEGSEISALLGAQRLIRERAPKLAVCLYHQPDDFWRIPLLVHSLQPDYRLYVRSHRPDGYDFILYAIHS